MVNHVASAGRSRLLALAAICALLAGSYFVLIGLPRAEAQPAGYTGCVNPFTGAFRVLLYTTACGPAEVPVSFGATGPQGPPGPPGPQGPQGTPGTILSVAQFATINSDGFAVGDHMLSFGQTGPSFGSNITQPGGFTFRLIDPGIYRVDFSLTGEIVGIDDVAVLLDGAPTGAAFSSVEDATGIGDGQLMGTTLVEVTSAPSDLHLEMTVDAGTVLTARRLIITQLTSTAP